LATVFVFDAADGTAELVCGELSLDNSTFMSANIATGCIYAGSEIGGGYEGVVSAYRCDPAGRRLRYINAQPTLGSLTAHVCLDREGRHLFATSYGGMPAGEGPDRAVVIYALRENGGLDAPGTGIGLSGCGQNPARRERSHPRCSPPTPTDASWRWPTSGSTPSSPTLTDPKADARRHRSPP